MKIRGVLLALAWALSVAGAEPGPNVLEIYPLDGGDPDALVEMARHLSGPDGQVTLDRTGQRVLVLTTRERQDEVARLFRAAAPAPLNVRLDVRFKGRASSTRRAAAADLEGGIVYEGGLSRGTFRVRPRVENNTLEASSDTVQTLVVANGRAASLRIGEDVPYLTWILDYGYRSGVLRQDVTWQQVGSFLAVEAFVVGEGPMVRLRLTPELRGLVDGRPAQARFAAVATEVVVQEGQSFALGGLASAHEFFSRFLVGYGRGGTQEALDISVTAHIVRPQQPPRGAGKDMR